MIRERCVQDRVRTIGQEAARLCEIHPEHAAQIKVSNSFLCNFYVLYSDSVLFSVVQGSVPVPQSNITEIKSLWKIDKGFVCQIFVSLTYPRGFFA